VRRGGTRMRGMMLLDDSQVRGLARGHCRMCVTGKRILRLRTDWRDGR
jgi:hypothetical protein